LGCLVLLSLPKEERDEEVPGPSGGLPLLVGIIFLEFK